VRAKKTKVISQEGRTAGQGSRGGEKETARIPRRRRGREEELGQKAPSRNVWRQTTMKKALSGREGCRFFTHRLRAWGGTFSNITRGGIQGLQSGKKQKPGWLAYQGACKGRTTILNFHKLFRDGNEVREEKLIWRWSKNVFTGLPARPSALSREQSRAEIPET